MVGKRNQAVQYPTSKTGDDGENGDSNGNGNFNFGKDNGRPRPRVFRYKDTDETAAEDERREELKQQLLKGIDRDGLEKFRKSDEELKEIKEKKIRKFYEHQNERLNDWLEVDTLVQAMASDIFDSFDPDRDHDGYVERDTRLRQVEGDVEALLPEDEKEARQKGAKKAKWAINVNVLANILLLAAKIGAVFFSSSLSLIASLVDSALDLLCTLIVWSTNKLVQWRLDSLRMKFPVYNTYTHRLCMPS